MNIKKSHRDQNCRPYVYKALQAGCNQLEIDLQKAGGEIVLGHTWRPALPFLFDCTLDQYLHRIAAAKKTQVIYLQLDIKEICLTKKQMIHFANLVVHQIKPFKDCITLIVSANAGLNRLKTLNVVYDTIIKSGLPVMLNSEWVKNNSITTEDLWI